MTGRKVTREELSEAFALKRKQDFEANQKAQSNTIKGTP